MEATGRKGREGQCGCAGIKPGPGADGNGSRSPLGAVPGLPATASGKETAPATT